MTWLDSVSPSIRSELHEAGRLGAGRFEGPTVTCTFCNSETTWFTPHADGTVTCHACRQRSEDRYRAMTGASDAA